MTRLRSESPQPQQESPWNDPLRPSAESVPPDADRQVAAGSDAERAAVRWGSGVEPVRPDADRQVAAGSDAKRASSRMEPDSARQQPGRLRPDAVRPGPGRLRAEPTPAEPLWREALGRRLRALRAEQGETLVETAGRAGVSPQYLSEVERGRKDPSSEMIAALAGALRTTLIGLTEQVVRDLQGPASYTAPRGTGPTMLALAA